MKTEIIRRLLIKNIPSASGIEVWKNQLYVIGDDASHLFVLDDRYKLLQKIELFTPEKLKKKRIPKKHKADLEAMTLIELDGRKFFVMAGSGSKEKRDRVFVYEIASGQPAKEFSLKALYELLRNPAWIGEARLNIEAMATDETYIYLFQRGNISGRNVVFRFVKGDFFSFLTQGSGAIPKPDVFQYTLPSEQGLLAGFSGACWFKEKNVLLFSASIENTADEINDGEVLGSYVGVLPLPMREEHISLEKITEKSNWYKGKMESLAFLGKKDEGKYRLLAVTDNDDGTSELLELDLSL